MERSIAVTLRSIKAAMEVSNDREVGVHTGGNTRLAFRGKVLETITLFCNSVTPTGQWVSRVAPACCSLLPSGGCLRLLHLPPSGGRNESVMDVVRTTHISRPVLEAGTQDPGVGSTGPPEASPRGLWTAVSCPCSAGPPCVWVSMS